MGVSVPASAGPTQLERPPRHMPRLASGPPHCLCPASVCHLSRQGPGPARSAQQIRDQSTWLWLTVVRNTCLASFVANELGPVPATSVKAFEVNVTPGRHQDVSAAGRLSDLAPCSLVWTSARGPHHRQGRDPATGTGADQRTQVGPSGADTANYIAGMLTSGCPPSTRDLLRHASSATKS